MTPLAGWWQTQSQSRRRAITGYAFISPWLFGLLTTIGLSAKLSPKTNLRMSESLSYTPYYSFSPAAAIRPPVPGDIVSSNPDNPLAEVFVERLSFAEPGLAPIAAPGCTKVLLIDGTWPVPCRPEPAPAWCAATGALYTNRCSCSLRFRGS